MRAAERKKFHLRQFSAIWVILRSCRIYLAQFWLSRRRRRRRRRRRHRVGQVHVAVDQCHQSCLVAKNISVFFSPLSLGGHLFFPFPSVPQTHRSFLVRVQTLLLLVQIQTYICMFVSQELLTMLLEYICALHGQGGGRERVRERENERVRESFEERRWGGGRRNEKRITIGERNFVRNATYSGTQSKTQDRCSLSHSLAHSLTLALPFSRPLSLPLYPFSSAEQPPLLSHF